MRAKRGSLPLFVLVLLLSEVARTQGQESLLVPTTKGSFRVERRPTVIRQRRVLVDFLQLRNKRIRLPLFARAEEIVLVRGEKESGQSGAFVWEGEVEGQPGSWAILANVGEVLVGDVMTRDPKGEFGFYQIRYLGDRVHALRKVDQAKFPPPEGRAPFGVRPVRPGPGRSELPRPDHSVDDHAARFVRAVRHGGDQADSAGALVSTAPLVEPALSISVPAPDCEDPTSQIDVLVVYTAPARRAAEGKDAMLALIELAVRSTNRSYLNSDIAQRLRLVHKQEVSYQESGVVRTDLENLQNGRVADVRTLRNDHAADAVVLIVDEPNDEACGWAEVMKTVSHDFEDRAYAVVVGDCASLPVWAFAHELGHIMGARHNREDDPIEGKPFAFNHGFIEDSPTVGRPWHTIMAKDEASRLIPWWSNPDVGYPTPAGDRLGTRNTDNQSALNETASTVAHFRCASP
jgi:metallopeptidase family M12-like protein